MNHADHPVRCGSRVGGKKEGYSLVITPIVVDEVDEIKDSVKDICREVGKLSNLKDVIIICNKQVILKVLLHWNNTKNINIPITRCFKCQSYGYFARSPKGEFSCAK